ncbi:StAR-related lipid transfer protein 5 [Holothuria leucospilota]|uniref:StAR-related lipid transfer protein 5 n=1 Tax=Holothuria leucospilota TaxID=206669 RepID=A0A9Q1BNI9_HOLLE|nr:StAR-related lipid transfer protein 5 [Holothuria leucospilota]
MGDERKFHWHKLRLFLVIACSLVCYKVVFEVDCGLERAIQSLYPAPKGFREKWDPNLQRSEILEEIDEDTWVMLSLTKPAFSGVIAAREFIDVVRLKRVPNKHVIVSGQSVEYPSLPVKKDIVRGYNYPCGTLWELLQNGKVRISVMYHSDIGGRLPRRIVETALPSVMMSDVEALLAYLKNEN